MKRILSTIAFSTLLTLPLPAQSPDAVTGSDGADLLIPIAGRAPGAGGELFLTDLTLVNFDRDTQRIELTWLPQGGTHAPQIEILDLAGRVAFTSNDVAGTVFGATGVGAIRIRAVDELGAADADARIDAHARIWTETTCAGLGGTVSQSVPAVVLDAGAWRNCSGAYAHGARQNTQFRTNYGIVNLGEAAQSFRVIFSSESGRFEEIVTVPAFGTVHRAAPAGVGGEVSFFVGPPFVCAIGGAPVFPSPWRAYATTVDNFSGSGWTMVAMQPRTDPQLD